MIISHSDTTIADLSADRKSWRKSLFLRRFDVKNSYESADPVLIGILCAAHEAMKDGYRVFYSSWSGQNITAGDELVRILRRFLSF